MPKVDPYISDYFQQLQPSPLRGAKQIAIKRADEVRVIDASIGSVSFPTYPAIKERMGRLSTDFADGSLPYTPTAGTKEAQDAFRKIAEANGVDWSNLHIQITNGGSLGMEYMMLGACSEEKPLMGFSPLYANYSSYSDKLRLPVVTMQRELQDDGVFTMPSEAEVESFVEQEKPSALLVIPADNPTGAYFSQERLEYLAKLCVKHNMWLVGDEAYFGLQYTEDQASSIWRITEEKVPGITGRRLGIHSASKNMNSCGLRIGSLVTDNEYFSTKAVNCASADLGAGIVDQYLFGAMAEESVENIHEFLENLKNNYVKTMKGFREKLLAENDKLIVSQPEASIYQVVDFKKATPEGFKVLEFINWAAAKGKVMIDGKPTVMIGAPMSGFYRVGKRERNPGDTQLRVAFVRDEKEMLLGAEVLAKQLEMYLNK